ncbi:hypothetical protein SUGI_0633840 [Cryptomeria japonica]|nr:hypothetical protein SUGI_0633840 [Cryptomeria japonica]
MEKCDSFWQWGNAHEKFSFCEISSSADGFNKMAVSEIPAEEGIWKRRRCLTSSSIQRSHRNSEGNALKSVFSCRYVDLQARSSSMGASLSKSGALIEANTSKSPISAFQGHVFSSDASTSNSDTFLSHPRGDSSPELDSSNEKMVQEPVLCDRKNPSKLMEWRRGRKSGAEKSCPSSDKGIHNSYTHCRGEISLEISSSCSVSGEEAEGMQSQSCLNSMRKLRAPGDPEPTSSYIDWFCKRPKTRQILISKNSFESRKEKSELIFEDLHMLADVAIRGLVPGFKEEDRAKASSEQWVGKAVCSPTGISFWQKRVVRRAKSAFKHVSPSISVEKQMSANSKSLSTTELCSFGCLNPQDNKVTDGVFGDEDRGEIQNVRCSKRSRSQFLNSKYCDSVLQPWKRGIRR